LKDEIEKINKQFGSSATNEFPTFNFKGNKNMNMLFKKFTINFIISNLKNQSLNWPMKNWENYEFHDWITNAIFWDTFKSSINNQTHTQTTI